MSAGREFQRLGADRLTALDLVVVLLADGEELDGRRGPESAGGCVDVDQFRQI